MIQKRAQDQSNPTTTGQREMISVQMTERERQQIRDSVKLKVYESKDTKQMEKNTEAYVEKSANAQTSIKKDLFLQKE